MKWRWMSWHIRTKNPIERTIFTKFRLGSCWNEYAITVTSLHWWIRLLMMWKLLVLANLGSSIKFQNAFTTGKLTHEPVLYKGIHFWIDVSFSMIFDSLDVHIISLISRSKNGIINSGQYWSDWKTNYYRVMDYIPFLPVKSLETKISFKELNQKNIKQKVSNGQKKNVEVKFCRWNRLVKVRQ